MTSSTTSGWNPDKVVMALFCCALATRFSAFIFLPDYKFPDAEAYIEAGIKLFETGDIGNPLAMPLYPILTYLFGNGLVYLELAASAFTVWLVYRLTIEISQDYIAATLAGLITAGYPHFIFYSLLGLTETLYLFLVCLAFLLLYRKQFLWGSVVIVASILMRPVLDLLAPILLLTFSLVVHKETIPKALQRVGVYALVYVVLMAPWWVHNNAKYHTFVRLSLGDGIVLYSGNNPMNKSGGGVAYGGPNDDMDLSIFSHIRGPIERNNAMKAAAFDFIKENPGRFVELAGKKFVRFWRLWPYAPQYNKPLYIAVSLMSYGVVLLLSIATLLKTGIANWRNYAPFLLFAGYLTAIHMVTIGSIRYRLPIEPFLIVMASLSAAMIVRKWAPNLTEGKSDVSVSSPREGAS